MNCSNDQLSAKHYEQLNEIKNKINEYSRISLCFKEQVV